MASIKTSESVCKGHPDKLCDQISDAILDAILTEDKSGRVAVETLATSNLLVIAGEVTTTAKPDYDAIARRVVRDNGYTNTKWGFDDKNCEILERVHAQSPEIAQGVDDGGAGDQGFNVGFATNETDNFMPLHFAVARSLTRSLDDKRESGELPFIRPDGKSQVSIRYENGKAVEIVQITIAAAHEETISEKDLQRRLRNELIEPVVSEFNLPWDKADIVINGTGAWHIPGPASDTGLTGRKIVVDAYGSASRVGGGAFSGKDPSKVDRSGAYAARYLAKRLVKEGLAGEANVSLAWAIGVGEPLEIAIDTVDGQLPEAELIALCRKWLPLSVRNIIEHFDLRRPLYEKTAAYGHFGHADLPWEKL